MAECLLRITRKWLEGAAGLRYLVEGRSAHDFAQDSEYREVQKMLAKQAR